MTSEKAQRILWAMLPGIVAGLLAAGGAWGAIKVELQYMQRDIERIGDRALSNTKEINRHRFRDH